MRIDTVQCRACNGQRWLNDRFRKLAQSASDYLGTSQAFALALSMVILWALAGPYYQFSDSWELVINTSTTIVTFLMVFLIQNTQNRNALAIHLKLDELLRAIEGARNSLVSLENLPDEEMERLKEEFAGVSDPSSVAGPSEHSRPSEPRSD